jgi:hypothetical protein
MSSALSFSDLSLEDKDQIQRMGRRIYLQFVTLDYIILSRVEQLNSIIHQSNQNTSPGSAEPNQNTSPGSAQKRTRTLNQPNGGNNTDKPLNPYRLDSAFLKDIISIIKYLEEAEEEYPSEKDLTMKPENEENKKDLIIRLYSEYIIALTLQRLFSYGLVDTRRIFDLKSVLIEGIESSSDIDATNDDLDEDVRNYYTEILRKRMLEELEKANQGSPVSGNVADIILQVLLSMGDLTEKETADGTAAADVDILLEGRSLDENVQAQKEIDLAKLLFEQVEGAQGEPKKINDTDAGLHGLFQIFNSYLPNKDTDRAIDGIINSSLYNNVPSAWSALFGDAQPEIIDILVGLLPTIEDRFRTSTTNSESQSDMQYDGLQVMLEFLRRTLTPIRLKELQDLLEDPNANAALVTFRSLHILKKIRDWQRPASKADGAQNPPNYASPTRDPTDRLGYLKLIHWCLTDEKELNIIFDYAYRFYIPDTFPNKDHLIHIAINDKNPQPVIAAAMFPGTLELNDMLPGGGMLIDMNYRRDQKNKQILETRLSKAGGLESALKQSRVRWYP